MKEFFDRRSSGLDTSLPSVRHVQDLIRSRSPVSITLFSGQQLEGSLKWQDDHYLALHQEDSQPLVLINRSAVAVIRNLS